MLQSFPEFIYRSTSCTFFHYRKGTCRFVQFWALFA